MADIARLQGIPETSYLKSKALIGLVTKIFMNPIYNPILSETGLTESVREQNIRFGG